MSSPSPSLVSEPNPCCLGCRTCRVPPSRHRTPGQTPRSPAGCSRVPLQPQRLSRASTTSCLPPLPPEPMRVTPGLCRSPRETAHRQARLRGVNTRVAGAGRPPSPGGRRGPPSGTRSLPSATGPRSRGRLECRACRPPRPSGSGAGTPPRGLSGRAEASPRVWDARCQP